MLPSTGFTLDVYVMALVDFYSFESSAVMILPSMAGRAENGVHKVCHGVLIHGMLRMAAIPSEIAFIYTESARVTTRIFD